MGRPKAEPKTRQQDLESKEYLGEESLPGQGGSAGGELQRDIADRDELKRSKERPAGATRVRGEDEKDD